MQSFSVGEWQASRAMNRIERPGHSLALEPLAMDVLVHLAERPGEVVSIDELIARIWNGRASDGSVYRTINQLRRALEGEEGSGSYIQTIRKRGYRLVARVLATETNTPAARNNPAPAPVDAALDSIAVLPFENLSPDPEHAFFADGMHGEVLSQLAKISSLKVISRTSVLEYRKSAKSVRAIAQELGVQAILEGSVQRAGPSARINVRLIDAARDKHLWTQTYERTPTTESVFAIQREIAIAVAAALQAALLPHEAARLKRVPTKNARAYDHYLAGNAVLDEVSYSVPSSWYVAVDAFTRAVQEDPAFALAWTALSRVHSMLYHLFIDRTAARLVLSREALEKARALDPDMPEFHLAAGEYYYRSSLDYANALAEFDLAARGMPYAPEPLIARALVYKRLGRWEQALETFEQARVLDPRNIRLMFNEADTYVTLREYEVAEEYLDRAMLINPNGKNSWVWRALIPMMRDGNVVPLRQMVPDDNDWVYHLQWNAALYACDYEGALEVLRVWPRSVFVWPWSYMLKPLAFGVTHDLRGEQAEAKPFLIESIVHLEAEIAKATDDPRLYIALGEAFAALGDRESALRAARTALTMRPRAIDAYLSLVYQLDAVLRVFIRAGAVDESLQLLDDYLSTRGSGWSIEGLLPNPRLDPLRKDRRFPALVDKHRR